MSRRRFVLAFILAAAAVFLVIRRPWERPPPAQPPPFAMKNNDLGNLNPANTVTLRCVIPAGDERKVAIVGKCGGIVERTYIPLKAGDSRDFPTQVPGPFTITAVTIERGGQTHKQELDVTIPAGQTRVVRIKPDDSVEVVAP